jgi:IS30 family transposase
LESGGYSRRTPKDALDGYREMARHQDLSQRTGLKVYFAHPHSPWERERNENTNGLLRQYLPKGEDLSGYSQDELDDIAENLNARPRKSLGWKAPIVTSITPSPVPSPSDTDSRLTK